MVTKAPSEINQVTITDGSMKRQFRLVSILTKINIVQSDDIKTIEKRIEACHRPKSSRCCDR